MFYVEREKHPLELKINSWALLAIDVQRYFFDPGSPAYLKGSERVLENIKALARIARSHGAPVFLTVHVGGSASMKRWWGNVVPAEFAAPMLDLSLVDHVIEKDTYDAFHGTGLYKLLKGRSVEQILICGVMTHLCCETTARSAFVLGLEVAMVEDCLWDKDEWYHYASLKNLAHGFATITSSEEVADKLEHHLNGGASQKFQ